MRVIDEPGGDIRPPRLQTARSPLPDHLIAGDQVLADRLAVPARVTTDRRLIPAAHSQSMYLHVVLLCEQSPPVPLARHRVRTDDGEGDPRQNARRARGSTPARSYGTRLRRTPRACLRPSQGGEFW